ncbi:hypothetical protein EZ428_15115 [Pedobacter frigiditerrae]|uniref:AhpC/TSA family protein n=1 Tax=Pedobacter frigiditerrae TaxID=2530452 RepID=A0A4R0MXA8_9SPHI|nr:hypothetical protein [Pedobacter frigiditerrae]TCC90594.1 hypothetical protein EZ428_15115 [Pedobacter frigiditerrae]
MKPKPRITIYLFLFSFISLFFDISCSRDRDNRKPINSANLKDVFFNNYVRLIVPSDGKLIDQSTILIDTNLVERKIGQLAKKKHTLVFRYSASDCEMCVNSVFKIIKEENNKLINDNILIVTDSYSSRDFIVKTKYLNFFLPIYDVKEPIKGLGLPLEGKNLPFFFILGPDNRISKIFFPYKEYPDKTREYFSYINTFIKEKHD